MQFLLLLFYLLEFCGSKSPQVWCLGLTQDVYRCRFVGGEFYSFLRCGGCVIRCDARLLAEFYVWHEGTCFSEVENRPRLCKGKLQSEVLHQYPVIHQFNYIALVMFLGNTCFIVKWRSDLFLRRIYVVVGKVSLAYLHCHYLHMSVKSDVMGVSKVSSLNNFLHFGPLVMDILWRQWVVLFVYV